MGSKSINGKQYRRVTSFKTERAALNFAAENRKGNWNSRVIKEGSVYAVYNRKIRSK